MLINRKPLEGQVPSGAIMRLHRPRQVDRTLHAQIPHAVLHHLEIDGHHARHLNRTAEGDLTVALREMQVADAELGAGDVDGEVHLAAPAEIFDIAVPPVFRPSWV